jgi:hypothetical protein
MIVDAHLRKCPEAFCRVAGTESVGVGGTWQSALPAVTEGWISG